MNYELHELCEIIPSMDDSEYLALVSDIRDNGLLNPIIVFEGKILDGRHRYKACVELDLEPSFVEYTGNKPSSFVRSVNLERRHFEKSQRSMIISLLQNWDNSHPAYRVKKEVVINNHLSTTADRARDAGVSISTQKKSDAIVKANPELAKEVAHGKKSINEATREVAPQLLNKPKSEPEQAEPEYTELDQLRDDNSELRDRIVDLERLCQIAGIDTGITDDVLNDAKKQIKDLEANLKAVTTSRDFFMNENAQLKRQLKLNKKAA